VITIRAFGPLSSTTGIAVDLDFKTISIGFSRTVSNGLIGLTNRVWLSALRGRSLRLSVISANGVPCNSDGSGETDACGVGRGGGSSGVEDTRDPRAGALFLFRGDALFDGDSGSGCIVSSGSKISDGSMFSFVMFLFPRPPVLGVGIALVVFRLDCGAFLGLRLGAGVKSSSSSSNFDCMSSSSSSDSTTIFLRDAALLDGLTGDSDILRIQILGALALPDTTMRCGLNWPEKMRINKVGYMKMNLTRRAGFGLLEMIALGAFSVEKQQVNTLHC
jgi:hypothetical protein